MYLWVLLKAATSPLWSLLVLVAPILYKTASRLSMVAIHLSMMASHLSMVASHLSMVAGVLVPVVTTTDRFHCIATEVNVGLSNNAVYEVHEDEFVPATSHSPFPFPSFQKDIQRTGCGHLGSRSDSVLLHIWQGM